MTNTNTASGAAERHYADRDHMELGGYYVRHVSAMTGEALHAKSEIAAELGWRDREIDRLRAALASTPAQPVAILFEHEDGRYAVNPDTTGDPAWHRLGPVDISAIATPAQSGLADAYVGAREDLSIWKRRALEAEATVRNFVREVNSSTFMGDPVSDECPHGDAHIVNDCLRCGAPVCCGKCCAAESTPTAQADSVQEEACHAPPLGWRCTRKAGHEGPCAAVECEDDKLFVERGMQRIRDAEDAAQKEGE